MEYELRLTARVELPTVAAVGSFLKAVEACGLAIHDVNVYPATRFEGNNAAMGTALGAVAQTQQLQPDAANEQTDKPQRGRRAKDTTAPLAASPSPAPEASAPAAAGEPSGVTAAPAPVASTPAPSASPVEVAAPAQAPAAQQEAPAGNVGGAATDAQSTSTAPSAPSASPSSSEKVTGEMIRKLLTDKVTKNPAIRTTVNTLIQKYGKSVISITEQDKLDGLYAEAQAL